MAKRFFDIRQPAPKKTAPQSFRVPMEIPYIPIASPEPAPVKNKHLRMPVFATLAIFLLVLGIFGLNLIRFKRAATESAPIIYGNFKEGAKALFSFELDKAKKSFEDVSKQLTDLKNQNPLRTVPEVLKSLLKISENAVQISGDLENLKANGLAMIIGKRGRDFISVFSGLKTKILEISNLSADLKSQAATIGYQVDGEFSLFDEEFGKTLKTLDAFLAWLEVPKKQRLLIFFQNPSEIRPGGGFIGSYAMATLFQANLLDVQVRDIYDPDGQLDLKVVPPKPLQGVTDRWGARDANWFFDFPTSAAKVTEFLEASNLYKEQGIEFSGAIAVNVEVVKDILAVVGPIELPDYKLTIGTDNFLSEVQREVETGEDKTSGEPKRILKVLTPILFERLSKLNEEEKRLLVEKFNKRIEAKDIMVYFKDQALEDYLVTLGAAGEVARLSENFTGDYLAVINANVAGGKSDAFMDQKIILTSKIGERGLIENHLEIKRTHNGAGEKEWWYKATNKNFLQIFTTAGSELEKMTGGTVKTLKPFADFSSLKKDPDLTAIEKKGALVFGKTLFSTWFDVKAGESKKIIVDYISPKPLNLALATQPYEFIYEKQSGVNGEVEFLFEAPEGFIWKESNSQTFRYSSEDPAGRIILKLNLEKIAK